MPEILPQSACNRPRADRLWTYVRPVAPGSSREQSPDFVEVKGFARCWGWSGVFEFCFQLFEFFGKSGFSDEGSCCCDTAYLSEGFAVSG